MRRLFLFMVLALSAPASAVAQDLVGRVADAQTGEALPGATVSLDELHRGTAVDAEGRYTLRPPEPGRYTVVVRFLGYETARRSVILRADRTTTLDVRLNQATVNLQTVDVVSAQFQEQRNTQASLVAVEPEQARILPGAVEDVLRALQAAPGVLAANDFSSQLVVRGGGPDQNLIILDDVEVFNPYRLYGVVSMFNPVVVSDIHLITGGFPARYGDRLSSVLEVQTRDGSTGRRLQGSVNTSIANTNAVLEGRTGFLNGSWLLTGRRTYYDLILGLVARRLDALEDNITFPNFADLQGKVVLRPASGHKVVFGGILSRDRLDLAARGGDPNGSDADRFAADDLTRNHVASVAWHWAPTSTLLLKTVGSWYRNDGSFGSDGRVVPRDRFDGSAFVASNDTLNTVEFAYNQSFIFRKWSGLHQLAWQRGRHFVEAGAGLDFLRTTLRFDLDLNPVGRAYFESIQQNNPLGPGAFPETFDQGKSYYRTHAYVQERLTLFNERLFVQPGLRFAYYRIIRKSYVSPRLNVSFAVTPSTTLRAAWGRYVQSPGFEKLLDRLQVFDLSQEAGIERLDAERTTHFVGGLSHWLNERYLLRFETYLKRFDRLLVQQRGPVTRWVAEYTGDAPPTDPTAYTLRRETVPGLLPIPEDTGRGTAYGFEFVLEKRYSQAGDRLSGWLSYAYAHAYRSRPGALDPDRPIRMPFEYDRRHVANLVFNYRLGRRWELGMTWRYGSPFPYIEAVGYTPLVIKRLDVTNPEVEPEAEVFVNAETGQVRFDVSYGGEENLNAARLPAYHRLDLRLSRRAHWLRLDWEFYLDVINVYNRRNVLAYQYRAVTDPEHPERPPELIRDATTMFPILPTLGFSFRF